MPNKNLSQNRWEEEVPFAKEQLKWQCFAKPVIDSRELNLFFPFIDEEKIYKSQLSRLTPEIQGLINYKEIVKEWIFEEQKGIADVDFKFKQKTPASRFTSKIAAVMQKPLPRKWLLNKQSRLRKFNADLIIKGLDYLRPNNFKITLYGTEYKAEKIPEEFLFILTKLEVEKKEVKELSLVPRLLRNNNANSVKAKLYTDLVRDTLEKYSYDADLASL
ncbi:ubiquitin carboxyl-terminal hydrolase [Apiospora phragmitis]|uniref:Ubiquitin carboxyl-terminal hydrolase n=1 Tax=Apiospora phragmitis TaxID=2905665 RepID=A0ABR1VQ34_9PEZI